MHALTYQKKYAIVVHEDRGPCFQVRFGNWMHLLNTGAGGQCEIIAATTPIFDETILAHTASVTFQRFTGKFEMDIKRLAALKKKLHFDIVLDYDDILFSFHGKSPIPEYNPYKADTFSANAAIRRILRFVDRITVSTAALALAITSEFPELRGSNIVKVVPNFAFTSLAWDEPRRGRKKPLVAYTGSISHFSPDDPGDLQGPWLPAINDAVKRGLIDLHVFGEDSGPFNPKKVTVHPHVYASEWLSFLSRLAPDIILAPLANNDFNRCKSPLKALEAALVGAAFVGGIFPMSPYNEFLAPATGIMPDEPAENVTRALELLRDPSLRKDNAEFVARKVTEFGLIAETEPAKDLFISALFGQFVHKT